jgi:hypothetical protein
MVLTEHQLNQPMPTDIRMNCIARQRPTNITQLNEILIPFVKNWTQQCIMADYIRAPWVYGFIERLSYGEYADLIYVREYSLCKILNNKYTLWNNDISILMNNPTENPLYHFDLNVVDDIRGEIRSDLLRNGRVVPTSLCFNNYDDLWTNYVGMLIHKHSADNIQTWAQSFIMTLPDDAEYDDAPNPDTNDDTDEAPNPDTNDDTDDYTDDDDYDDT